MTDYIVARLRDHSFNPVRAAKQFDLQDRQEAERCIKYALKELNPEEFGLKRGARELLAEMREFKVTGAQRFEKRKA
ncbi:hypothetical protein HDU86_006615 [Geranomyces michiganensis]|nr:hypothetical protein HDU86_006615 [Geranomyces michiganensis]